MGLSPLPPSRIVRGTVYALDIEPEMVRLTQTKAEAEGLRNVRACLRDFVAEGSGLPSASVQYAMLFNILHAEGPQRLLREARRVLTPGGLLGIVHWNYDAATLRGPSMEIRPRPEQCCEWAVKEGFRLLPPGIMNLPPYHYGMVLERPRRCAITASPFPKTAVSVRRRGAKSLPRRRGGHGDERHRGQRGGRKAEFGLRNRNVRPRFLHPSPFPQIPKSLSLQAPPPRPAGSSARRPGRPSRRRDGQYNSCPTACLPAARIPRAGR